MSLLEVVAVGPRSVGQLFVRSCVLFKDQIRNDLDGGWRILSVSLNPSSVSLDLQSITLSTRLLRTIY